MGFIGSHTVDKLVSEGYETVVLDNLEKQVHGTRKPPFQNKRAKYMAGDIRSPKAWLKALVGVDAVIHLAAAVGVGQSFWQARKYTQVNVVGTATLFELLTKEEKLRKRIRKIVVASSKSIYGEGAYLCKQHGLLYPDERKIEQLKRKEWEVKCDICGKETLPAGIPESKPAQNLNPYALSKYATERLSLSYSKTLGIPTVAFRYFNVYGPRQSLSNPYTGVLAIFISRLKNGNAPVMFEDGQQQRDFIFVDDVASANVTALDKGEGAFNLGTGRTTSLLKMSSLISGAMGVDMAPQVTGEFRPGDNRHDFADVSLYHRVFGERNVTNIEKGIEILVEWSNDIRAVDKFLKEESQRVKYLAAR